MRLPWDRRPTPFAGVVGLALLLGEAVEPGPDQDRLQAVVEGVPGRARQLRPADHQVRLSLTLPAQRHARSPRRHGRNESARPEFVNGLLIGLPRSPGGPAGRARARPRAHDTFCPYPLTCENPSM